MLEQRKPSSLHASKVLQAITEVQTNKSINLRQIALKYGLNLQDLYKEYTNFLKNKKTQEISSDTNKIKNRKKFFTTKEETRLAIRIKNTKVEVNEQNIKTLAYKYAIELGKEIPTVWKASKRAAPKWYKGFISRNSKVLYKPSTEEEDFNSENLKTFHHQLSILTEKNNIVPERIFILDQMDIETTEESVKFIGIISINKVLPPCYLFPTVKAEKTFLQGAVPGSLLLCDPLGWNSSSQNFRLLLSHMQINTDSSTTNPLILILNLSKNNFDFETETFCNENGIHLLSFPVQKLQGVFQNFKTYINEELMKHPSHEITLNNVIETINIPIKKAFTKSNVDKFFEDSGIWPINRYKLITPALTLTQGQSSSIDINFSLALDSPTTDPPPQVPTNLTCNQQCIGHCDCNHAEIPSTSNRLLPGDLADPKLSQPCSVVLQANEVEIYLSKRKKEVERKRCEIEKVQELVEADSTSEIENNFIKTHDPEPPNKIQCIETCDIKQEPVEEVNIVSDIKIEPDEIASNIDELTSNVVPTSQPDNDILCQPEFISINTLDPISNTVPEVNALSLDFETFNDSDDHENDLHTDDETPNEPAMLFANDSNIDSSVCTLVQTNGNEIEPTYLPDYVKNPIKILYKCDCSEISQIQEPNFDNTTESVNLTVCPDAILELLFILQFVLHNKLPYSLHLALKSIKKVSYDTIIETLKYEGFYRRLRKDYDTENYEFYCKYCSSQFTTIDLFFQHFNITHKLSFTCFQCKTNFSNLTEHISSHHNFIFNDYVLQLHWVQSINQYFSLRLRHCLYCVANFQDFDQLFQHVTNTHYNCRICSVSCKNSNSLFLHNENHASGKVHYFQCKSCDYKNYDLEHMNEHMKLSSTCTSFSGKIIFLPFKIILLPFKCPYCPLSYITENNLIEHLLCHSTQSCTLCLTKFIPSPLLGQQNSNKTCLTCIMNKFTHYIDLEPACIADHINDMILNSNKENNIEFSIQISPKNNERFFKKNVIEKLKNMNIKFNLGQILHQQELRKIHNNCDITDIPPYTYSCMLCKCDLNQYNGQQFYQHLEQITMLNFNCVTYNWDTYCLKTFLKLVSKKYEIDITDDWKTSFGEIISVKIHEFIENPLHCISCDKTFSDTNTFLNHFAFSHFYCRYCKMDCDSLKKYLKHNAQHSIGYTFQNLKHLNINETYLFSCPYCSKNFFEEISLNNHIKHCELFT